MNKSLLPIGTVVLLSGGTKKIMITGYSSKTLDDTKVYDYNGCVFPEGFVENVFCLFDKNQIEDVIYMGLKNEEYDNYVRKMTTDIDFNSVNELIKSENSSSKKGNSRYRRKSPTKPLSSSEMRARYTSERISGGQTEKFDFSKLERK